MKKSENHRELSDEALVALKKIVEVEKKELLLLLEAMSDRKVLRELRFLNNDELKFLFNSIALPLEGYEICQIINKVLAERELV